MATLFRGRVITCQVCGELKRVARSDATMCSSKCRMRFKRKCDAVTQGTAVVPDAKRAAAGSLPPMTPAVAVTSPRPEVTANKPPACKNPMHKLVNKLTGKVKGPWGNGLPADKRYTGAAAKAVVRKVTKKKGRAK